MNNLDKKLLTVDSKLDTLFSPPHFSLLETPTLSSARIGVDKVGIGSLPLPTAPFHNAANDVVIGVVLCYSFLQN